MAPNDPAEPAGEAVATGPPRVRQKLRVPSAMPETDPRLVLGRNCDACNVCCEVLTIDVPELKKLPGTLCPNCQPGGGCKIYETRPQLCRAWYCGWRKTEALGPEWRPDRCKILIYETDVEIPATYVQHGLTYELLGDPYLQIQWLPLIERIAIAVHSGVPVFLAVPGPPGHHSGKVFLNDNSDLRAAVESQIYERLVGNLTFAVEACVRHRKNKVELG